MKRIAFLVVALWASSACADPVKILKSHIGPSFANEVASYGQQLSEWKEHMAHVAADKAANVPKDKAYAPYPAPVAPAEVMSAVDENGHPNYQIVDDGPTPDQVLSAKKQALFDRVSIIEDQAIQKIIPHGKLGILNYRSQQIEAKDTAAIHAAEADANLKASAFLSTRHQLETVQQGISARLLSQGTVSRLINGPSQPTADEASQVSDLQAQADQKKALADAARDALANPEAVKKAARNSDDQAFVEDRTAKLAKIDAIHHWAAQENSDIDDLTAANVDAYQVSSPPE